MDKLFLLLLLPIVIGYWIYAIWSYDWSNFDEDIKRMGEDMW
jgi:hypothetical protein